jgi:hypothetical protein
MALDPASGHFTYTPGAEDKEHFTVTIQASKAGRQPLWQVVDFDPMPHLPAEQEVFGFALTHAMPDGASVDYIVRSEVLSATPESFNYVTRQTRMSAGAVFDGALSRVFEGRGYGRLRKAA